MASNVSLETVLNEIACIYRYQDCVFNTNINDYTEATQQQAPFQNVANSPRILSDEMNMMPCGNDGSGSNSEMVKTNMNYMSLNASEEKSNYNDGLILNKQTNDIYFKRVRKN